MSKQLTLSATLSLMAMAALAFLTFGQSAADSRGATSHGSLVRVLLLA